MKERFHFSSFRFDVVVIPSAMEYYNQIQEKNLRNDFCDVTAVTARITFFTA